MSLIITPVTHSNWTPVSAAYAHDEYIELYTSPMTTDDGYTVFNQQIFNGPKDTAINKNTIFYLPTSMNMMDFMFDSGLRTLTLGNYTDIKVNIGDDDYYFAINNDNLLYLSSNPNDALFIKIIVNSDRSLSFINDKNRYITVSRHEPLLLFLEEPLDTIDKYRQEFGYVIHNPNTVSFYTKSPPNKSRQRFWGYRTTGPRKYIVRANGFLNNTNHDDGINHYAFNIEDFPGLITLGSIGFNTNHRWVSYHNELKNKRNNKNVNLNDNIEVSVQHLIDLPYHNIDFSKNKAYVNISNLKSVMTENYNYSYINNTNE